MCHYKHKKKIWKNMLRTTDEVYLGYVIGMNRGVWDK